MVTFVFSGRRKNIHKPAKVEHDLDDARLQDLGYQPTTEESVVYSRRRPERRWNNAAQRPKVRLLSYNT